MEDNCIELYGEQIKYSKIREDMKGQPFPMVMVGEEAKLIMKAVNQGIDAHLEACNCPERGDQYEWKSEMLGRVSLGYKLHCVVSVESLPVLLRRLCEMESEEAESLVDDIITCIQKEDE